MFPLNTHIDSILYPILDAVPFAVSWATLPNTHIQYTNQDFDKLFGYPTGYFKTVHQVIEETYVDEYQRQRALDNWHNIQLPQNASSVNPITEVEVDVLCGDGQIRTVLHSGVILHDRNIDGCRE